MLIQLEVIKGGKLWGRYQIAFPTIQSQHEHGRPDMILLKYDVDKDFCDYFFRRDNKKAHYTCFKAQYLLERDHFVGFQHVMDNALRQVQRNIYNIKPIIDRPFMSIEDTEVIVDFDVVQEFTEELKWEYPDASELSKFYEGLNIDHEHLKMVNLEAVLQQRTRTTPIVQKPSLRPHEIFEWVIKILDPGHMKN